MFKLFSAERAGLLAIIVIILFIAGVTMCDGMGGGGDPLSPDSLLVEKVDSAMRADTVPSDTIAAKTRKHRASKTHTKHDDYAPYRRNHLNERVDTTSHR